MRLRNGFTLIEIIIVIVLISLVGTASILSINNMKNSNNDFNEITNRIIESTKVYIETEKDKNGKSFINGINNGGKGLIINLDSLYNEGYINEDDYKYIIKKVSDDKRYIIVGYYSQEDCKSGNISINVNWLEEGIKEPTYLCSYGESKKNPDIMLNVILKDNMVKLGIPNLNNYVDEDKGLYILPDGDGSSFYYYGKTKNNYLKFNNMIWRIVRINGNGSTRIILDDIFPYKLQKGKIVSIPHMYAGQGVEPTESYTTPIENEYYDSYEGNIVCFHTGGEMTFDSWRTTCFYDYEYDKLSGSNATHILNDNYKVLSDNNLETEYPDSIYKSVRYTNILSKFSEKLTEESKTKIKTDDIYYINNDYLYNKRDFTNEDVYSSTYESFIDGIQTISYKELKYSGGSNSYITDINKSFYTSDYHSDSQYYYYNSIDNEVDVEVEPLSTSDCTNSFNCKNRQLAISLKYPSREQFAESHSFSSFHVYGFRPVVNLLKDLCYKGEGTIDNPYEITECR